MKTRNLMLLTMLLALQSVFILPAAAAQACNTTAGGTACTGTGFCSNVAYVAPSPSVGLTGYNIYRGTAPGGESSTPLNAAPLPTTQLTYQDNTVVPGGTYYYTSAGVWTGGLVGPKSNESCDTFPAASAPTNETVTPQ